ncbi:MAG: isochorismatase family protein [Candidatus Nanoarchaeia archaeon]|nr:isochorismatase family protein [Candidatus Nanoarchaeia archaeon]
MKKALIVVDLQYDFCPGGALEVEDGDKIIPIINQIFHSFDLVIFTKDWHPANMDAFASQHEGKKPLDPYITKDGKPDLLWKDHCIADTKGAELYKGIDFHLIPKSFYIFKKGLKKDYHPYSGFEGTGLADFLREKEVTDTYIVGLNVMDTALDSKKEGLNTNIFLDGCKPPILSNTVKEFNTHDIHIIVKADKII